MALTIEQAINLVNQNEDTDKRGLYPFWDFAKILDFFYTCLRYYPDKSGRYGEILQEIDARIESCDFPEVIEISVYKALLNKEEIDYLINIQSPAEE